MNWAWATSLDHIWRSAAFPMWLTLAAAGFFGLIVLITLLRAEKSVANGALTVITLLAVGIAVASTLRGYGPAGEHGMIENRSSQVTTAISLPALACIDDIAGEAVEQACEKVLFGSAESTAAAVNQMAAMVTRLISLGDAATAQRSMTLLMRTQTNPAGYVSAIREVSRQIDPGIALRGVATLEEEVTDSIAIVRIMGILMGIFGLVALVLSSVGVYGVLSESVAQRTREIGIRVALGAETSALMKLILGHALKLTAIGLAIALPVSLAISRAMTSLIFGVVSMDVTIFAPFTAVMLLVALGAGYLPARRALRVDPMVVLRYE